MNCLKNHPFSVEAFFETSIVLTFAVPKAELENMIPEPLELDTFNDTWAFIAIAMVQTRDLRPKGFPKFLGNDFFLTGYRIFVKHTTPEGRRLRGLYIIKSETNKKKMQFFGNTFTRYNYTTTDIDFEISKSNTTITSQKSKFHIVVENDENNVIFPDQSPFKNWKDARCFSGPLPHTFSFSDDNKTMTTIRGIRKNWKPKPINVKNYNFQFLNTLQLQDVRLASAFKITNIPYHWEKGKVTKWI